MTLLTRDDVCAMLGMSKQSLWRWQRAYNFPEPIRMNKRVHRWRSTDVSEWIARLMPEPKAEPVSNTCAIDNQASHDTMTT